YTGRSVSVRGALDPEAMRAAFGMLRRAYPVLGCRIVEDAAEQGYLLRPDERTWTPATVRQGDVAAIGIPAVDPADQLAYLDIVGSDADHWRVTLFAHHSVADAGQCVELLSRLWEFYTDSVDRTPMAHAPQDLPQSLEWHVAARGITKGPLSGL